MSEEKIIEEYKIFNIYENQIPKYDNPQDFAKRFKKCSILKDVNTVYTGNTIKLTDRENKFIFY